MCLSRSSSFALWGPVAFFTLLISNLWVIIVKGLIWIKVLTCCCFGELFSLSRCYNCIKKIESRHDNILNWKFTVLSMVNIECIEYVIHHQKILLTNLHAWLPPIPWHLSSLMEPFLSETSRQLSSDIICKALVREKTWLPPRPWHNEAPILPCVLRPIVSRQLPEMVVRFRLLITCHLNRIIL